MRLRVVSALGLGLSIAAAASSAPWKFETRQLNAPDEPMGNWAKFSPDGEWIVLHHAGTAAGANELHAVRRWSNDAPIRLTDALTADQSANRFEISTAGNRVVFVANQDKSTGATELWSVPIDGSQPAKKLNPPAKPGTRVSEILLSPDGRRVLFTGNIRDSEYEEIWVAPIDGSRPAVRLHGNPVFGGDAGGEVFAFTPNGSRVLFIGDLAVNNRYELWSAPADGSALAVRVHPVPVAGGYVDSVDWRITADSSRVIFRAAIAVAGRMELWSAPVDASAAAVKLNPAIQGSGRLSNFELAESASRVAFVADLDGDFKDEIWSVPYVGPSGQAVRLFESTIQGSLVTSLLISSGRVVFSGDLVHDNQPEVWSTPIAGGSAPLRLSDAPSEPYFFPDPPILAGAGRVVFGGPYGGLDAVYSAPVDTANAATPIIQGFLYVDRIAVADGGRRLVFIGRVDSDSAYRLFSVPSDGSAPPAPISPEAPWSQDVTTYLLSEDGTRVAFEGTLETPDVEEIWNAPIAGPAADAVRISPPATEQSLIEVVGLPFDPDGVLIFFGPGVTGGYGLWLADHAVFRANFEEGNTSEWFPAVP